MKTKNPTIIQILALHKQGFSNKAIAGSLLAMLYADETRAVTAIIEGYVEVVLAKVKPASKKKKKKLA